MAMHTIMAYFILLAFKWGVVYFVESTISLPWILYKIQARIEDNATKITRPYMVEVYETLLLPVIKKKGGTHQSA
jgi:hypothetical protein